MARLRSAYEQVRDELLAERTPDGHWVGELSSSALSTATAVSALAVVRRVGWDKAAAAAGPPEQESAARSQGTGVGRENAVLSTQYSVLGTPLQGGDRRSTATEIDAVISRGVRYLATQQNPDGGFGDTDLSHSNIATTYLVVAALHLAEGAVGNALRGVPGGGMGAGSAGLGMPQRAFPTEIAELLAHANAYIASKNGLVGLRERYGIDKTFVVPIMTNLALAGLLDWREIDPLPFELACVPQSFYRFVGMPVVSYAIPALVAIGQARFHHAPPWNPITRLIRWLSISRSLKVLRQMQPDSGGYLEATPLTSFVVMSLASISSRHAPRDEPAAPTASVTPGLITRSVMATLADEVIHHGVKFLAASVRPDGSWPIDTNLATWNTTLAINALAGAGEDVAELLGVAEGAVGNALRGVPGATEDADLVDRGSPQRAIPTGNVLDWLLSCQHTKRHPFTGADLGGFGWSDLSGAVPDADDTPGTLLALRSIHINTIYMEPAADYIAAPRAAAVRGLRWLLRLQNRDGGWPTFCRGWGKLPFDRSGTDLTAHVLRARQAWDEAFGREGYRYRLQPGAEHQTIFPWEPNFRAHLKGLKYLKRTQHPDGSWSPLWFGNQDHPQEDNPVYGTAKVLFAYRDLGLMDSPEAQRGVAWLVANQNADGGWGSGVWGRIQNAEFRMQNGENTRRPNLNSEFCILNSSVEETALAVEALLAALPLNPEPRTLNPGNATEGRNATEGVPYSAVVAGLNWLLDRVEAGQHRQPAPIGFYFAKLWYYERLYPLTFTVAALGRACRQLAPAKESDNTEQPHATRAT